MSAHIDNVFKAEFDKEVKHLYQDQPNLKKTVRVKNGVVGRSHQFQLIGIGKAYEKTSQAKIVPMNVDYTPRIAYMKNLVAPEMLDVFDEKKISFDDRSALIQVISEAMVRAEDQIIIDALEASLTSFIVPITEGSNNFMNTAKFRKAHFYQNKRGVPKMGRSFIMSSSALNDMLGDEDADTFDKNAVKMLVNGELTYWLGFNVYDIGDMPEGGLPFTGGERTAFAYHNRAIGLAINKNMSTEINYIPENTSYLFNCLYSAGAVTIDDTGIVKIHHEETLV